MAYDVVIIGGGPAGLTAGIYAARARLKALLIERAVVGGLATTTEFIENYPGFSEPISGPELASRMEEQARRFGLEILYAHAEAVQKDGPHFLVTTEDGQVEGRTLIIATGAHPQKLNVKGEDLFYGRGVSYCATCDGAFFRDKRVAVVGGGDAAIEEALFLTKFAQQVYVIHRRDQLRATKVIQERARQNPRINFVWNSVVEEILGQDAVEGVRLKDVRTGEQRELNVSGVFVYIGYRPNSSLVKDLVKLDDQGYIITDEHMRTTCPGIFAAGDVRQKPLRQVVTAVADGAIAAFSAEKHLEG